MWIDRLISTGLLPDGRLSKANAADAAAALELFREVAPKRFFRGAEFVGGFETIRAQFPDACRDVIEGANCIVTGHFDLLGYKGLAFGDPIDWHHEPVAGVRAPLIHWSRIDPLDSARIGDSKVTWELNRHQWLISLAQAYCLTREERYSQKALQLMVEWPRSNPCGQGINWSSSLEVAYRTISWIWTLFLLRDSPALTVGTFKSFLDVIGDHARHIERYLSRYFSPNTHLTGEALGLFYVGTLFPEFPDSGRWRRIGREILLDECRRQVHPDGVYFEHATCYQRYTVDIYLHFILLAERNHVPLPAFVRDRVERMCAFLLALSSPAGTIPQIGDADGGCLLPLARRAPSDCRGLFATAAVVFGRSDFAAAAGAPAPEVLWLLGASGWDGFVKLSDVTAVADANQSQLFRDGGYAILRSDRLRGGHHLVFDVGPLGCPISGAHGHADMLSLQCSAFGETYLVDAGTYSYRSDIHWRNHFRGTSAHSTVMVDGAHQADPLGPFKWRSLPSARLRRWKSTDSFDYVDASHDGYARLRDPVVHRRRVLFVKPRYWVVVDDIDGGSAHHIQLRFQFAPKPVRLGPGLWASASGQAGEGLWILPLATVPLTGRIAEGAMDPPEGWLSSNYGVLEPAPVVVYESAHQLPVRIVSLLLPVKQLTQIPPRVEGLYDAEGLLTGLAFVDAGESVRFEDDSVFVEQPEPIRILAGALAD